MENKELLIKIRDAFREAAEAAIESERKALIASIKWQAEKNGKPIPSDEEAAERAERLIAERAERLIQELTTENV